MGVHRRVDNGKWEVDVTVVLTSGTKVRRRRTAPVQTKRGAEAYERDLRVALLSGSADIQPVPTLNEFKEEFLGYARNNNKASELAAKKRILDRHLVPFFGGMKLDEISSREVESFKAAKLEEDLKPKTINNQLACLRKLLNLAVDWEVLSSAPRVKALKCEVPTFDFLDFDEAERLIATASQELWLPMIVTALHTGLRVGELMALSQEDVDFKRQMLSVRRSSWKGVVGTPKNGKGRKIPLNERVATCLRRHRHLRGEWVFCRDDGAPLTEDIARRGLLAACRAAELRYIGWHGLRHTFASHLVMRGVPMKSVQELMGHASIHTTMRYSHLSPSVRRDAVDALLVKPGRDEVAGRN